jgi:sec-independent protein translocase protein TatC
MPTPADREEETGEQEELSGQMSFFDHLEELRRRIINSLIAVGVALAACLYFARDIYEVFRLLMVNSGADLNAPAITAGFSILLKMAFLAAIFLAAPFLIAQVWLFISPGLYKHERRYVVPFIIFSTVLFLLGGLFAYYIAVPFGIKSLVDINKSMGLGVLSDVNLAFNLVFALTLGLGVVFEIPAVIFLLSRLGLVTGSFLLKHIKYAVLLCFVAAAIITPSGDIPNMMVIAIPMIALYMLGIIVAFIFGKKRKTDSE